LFPLDYCINVLPVTDTSATPAIATQRGPAAPPEVDGGAQPVVATAPPVAKPARQWELDVLRVIAIAGVVAIHIFGEMVVNTDHKGDFRWWAAVGVDIGSNWVVPVFVMISGALVLAPRAHAAGPGAFYRKRFVRILPALVVWNLIYLFVVRAWWHAENLKVDRLAINVIDAKVYTALYFLFLIAGLYAVAPVLAAFLHAGGRRRAMVLAGVVLSWTLIAWIIPKVASEFGAARTIYLGAWNQWFPYVGYFVAGWALHRVVLRRRWLVLAGVVAVLLMLETAWQYGTRGAHHILDLFLAPGYLTVTTAIVAICVFLIAIGVGARVSLPPRLAALCKRLSDASFGVFLVHLMIFDVVQRAVPAVGDADSLWVLLAAYAGVLVASFAVSMGASLVPYVRAVF
jgi:surface polysaccharide O-acyltransferase-like enzyme